jgi:sugar phosphate permease
VRPSPAEIPDTGSAVAGYTSGAALRPVAPQLSNLVTSPALRDTVLQDHPSLRLRFVYLLPATFVTYSLAYLDRSNFGLGAAAGLGQTLHLDGSQLSLLSALFFLGYFIFQIPGAMVARRFGIGRLVFCSLFFWGILASLTGIVQHFWMLAVVRFLIGVAESVVFPVIVLLLTRWFTRRERSRSNTILMLGNPVTVLWMSALTGVLIDRIGWQKTFIYEGLPAVVWAFFWLALVRDRPRDTRWLTPEAVNALESRLVEEQQGLSSTVPRREILRRPDVLLLSLQYFCWSLGIYGFVLWLPTIVRQGASMHSALPHSMTSTGLLTALPYAVAVVCQLSVSYASDRTLHRLPFVWVSLLVGGLALFVSFLSAGHSFAIAFTAMILSAGGMYAAYGPYFALIAERVGSHALGETLALVNSCGALGGFAGSYLVGWLQSATGGPKAGFLLMATAVLASSLLMLPLRSMHVPEARTA